MLQVKVGLVGPNGSGKSTLLSIIRGEEQGFTGRVKSLGNISLVPQEIKHDPDMEKANLVRNYVDPEISFVDFEINKMLKGLELNINLDSDPKKLSGGQKTKLALARALMQNPDILLLDEPTTYLDVLSQRIILESLKQYLGTMIIVSHTPEFIKELKPDKAFLFPEQKMVYWDDELLDRIVEI